MSKTRMIAFMLTSSNGLSRHNGCASPSALVAWRRLVLLCWAAALTPADAWAADPAPQQQARRWVSSSPVVSGGGAGCYAKDVFVFADFNGDGEEELLMQTQTYEHPRRTAATMLRWNPAEGNAAESGRVEWSVPIEHPMKMLVGNIDDDPLPEMVVFDRVLQKLRVIQWDDGRVVETELALAGRIGLLADIDGDGRDELVLVRTRIDKFDVVFEEPSDLVAYAYRGGRFVATHKRELAVGVQALTSMDVNGDGRREVVTSETSFGNEVSGRLSVYRFEPGGAVPVAFRRNSVMQNACFLGAFRSGGVYLLAESAYGWQSVFRVREEKGALRVEPVGTDSASLPVFAAARLATAAYSAERDEFFQFAEDDQTRLVPVGPVR